MTAKHGGDRENTIMMASLATWMDTEKTASVISATKDRGLGKDIITNAMEQGDR